MGRAVKWVICVQVLVLICGCTHKSYHPWLGEDQLVRDSSMAGVWMGIELSGEDSDETEIFVIRPVLGESDNDEEKTTQPEAISTGYYAVSWIDNDSVEMPATVEAPFIQPKNLAAGLYRVDDTLLAQMWGNTLEGDPLVTPMYVVYRANFENEVLTLYNLKLDNLTPADLTEEGLLFEANKDDPVMFFSPTEVLTGFLEKHLHEKGFFNPEPSMKLKRVRDLSGIIMENVPPHQEVEMLEPTN